MLAELGMEYGLYGYEFVIFFAVGIEYFVDVLLAEGLLVSTVELLWGAVVAVHKIQILGLL